MKKTLLLLLAISCFNLIMAQSGFKRLQDPQKTIVKKTVFSKLNSREKTLMAHRLKKQVIPLMRTKSDRLPVDKSEVILEAHDVWESGTIGYQMLLDINHNTYNDVFEKDSYDLPEDESIYNRFAYKIPANADASQTTQNVIINGQGKVEIPAGIYDYAIVCPMYGDGIIFAKENYSRYDDFKFEGGYSYTFLVTFENSGEIAGMDIVTPFADIDAAVSNLVLPASSSTLGATETISMTVTNRGTLPISGFPVCYRIDNKKTVTEMCQNTLKPNQSLDFTFSTKADFSAEKLYRIKAWTDLPKDMILLNDTVSGLCKHVGITPLPFTYNFSNKEEFKVDWSIMDIAKDGITWDYTSYLEDPIGNPGVIWCATNFENNNDDYIVSAPIYLEQGANHLIFYICGMNPDYTELLDVRYGNSTDVNAMTVIGDYEVRSDQWKMKIANFNTPKSGTYYFAFHAKSALGNASVAIDEITIDRGVKEGETDLAMTSVILPVSGCDLSDQNTIRATVENIGTAPVTEFTLSYSINNGTTVPEKFTETILPDTRKTFAFKRTADLSKTGNYQITVNCLCDKDKSTENNIATGNITNYAPVTQLPYSSVFTSSKPEDWNPATINTWATNDFDQLYECKKTGTDAALYSRCFSLQTGKYRIHFSHSGGFVYSGASFYIAYGKSGTDISGWTTISTVENSYASTEQPTETEASLKVDEAAEYSFAIVPTSNYSMNLCLRAFKLAAMLENDLRMKEIQSPLPACIPAEQTSGYFSYHANIENRGYKAANDVKFSVLKNGMELFTSTPLASIASEESILITAKGQLAKYKAGDNISLSATVKANEKEMYPEDNTLPLPICNVTDSVYATERLKAFPEGTGDDGTARYGNLYTLSKQDTLTSMSIGLAQWYEEYKVPVMMAFAAYPVKEDGISLGDELFVVNFERGGEEGLRNISVPSRILSPGTYYFEVRQTGGINVGIGYDANDSQSFRENIDGQLILIQGAAICLRANFGHKAHIYKKDARMVSYTSPDKDKRVFYSEETIAMKVQNNGTETINGLDVYCQVNGQKMKYTIDRLEKYEQKTASFAVDLSAPGDYLITSYIHMKGDENVLNDTIVRKLTCVKMLSPYVMDFESCEDFSYSGWNPNWHTVDLIGGESNGFSFFDYPHISQPVGFLAFNPDATTPPMPKDKYSDCRPHSGLRFGGAFGTTTEDTDSDARLISPELELGTNSSLELYVKTFRREFDSELERYNILISETNDDPESFVRLGDEKRAAINWEKVEVDLNAYNNKTVYITIQYVSRPLQGIFFMVDDIRIKSSTGISSVENSDIRLFIIPGSDLLSIDTGSQELKQISLYSMAGQLMYQSTVHVGKRVFQLSVNGYSKGIYLARIQTDKGVQTIKFTIE